MTFRWDRIGRSGKPPVEFGDGISGLAKSASAAGIAFRAEPYCLCQSVFRVIVAARTIPQIANQFT